MLREIFFGKENDQLVSHTNLVDAEPREVYIISCLLVPIIGIGLYPRLMTDSYTASIQELVKRDELALQSIKKPSALMIRNTTMTPAVVSSPRLPISQTRAEQLTRK